MTQIFSKKSELESTFVETINPKRSNIVGVIDRYPSMDVTSTLLEWVGQIRYKKNHISSWYINLLNHNQPTNYFL